MIRMGARIAISEVHVLEFWNAKQLGRKAVDFGET